MKIRLNLYFKLFLIMGFLILSFWMVMTMTLIVDGWKLLWTVKLRLVFVLWKTRGWLVLLSLFPNNFSFQMENPIQMKIYPKQLTFNLDFLKEKGNKCRIPALILAKFCTGNEMAGGDGSGSRPDNSPIYRYFFFSLLFFK